MYAIQKTTAGQGLHLVEVPEPQPGPREVLIKVLKTSICGTDLHIHEWDDWARATIRPPLVIGHEFVGEIVQTGSQVQGMRIGDKVTGEGHIVCGHCRNCLAGRRHLCKETLGVGVHRNGAFAEYLSIPAENVWHVDPGVSLELYSIYDPLGNAVHTALTYDLVGEDVLITGAGPIGCMAAAICKHAGARHIVVTDPNPYRRQLAQALGATRIVHPGEESLASVMMSLGMKEGFDVGLEMSGHPQALGDMVDSVFHGGKIALLGILPRHAPIDWTKVIFNGLSITGIYGRKMYETWYKTTSMLQSGLIIDPIITHRLPYREFARGFQWMKEGTCGKVILEWA